MEANKERETKRNSNSVMAYGIKPYLLLFVTAKMWIKYEFRANDKLIKVIRSFHSIVVKPANI